MRTATRAETDAALAAARRGFGLAVEEIRPVPAWNSTVFRLATRTGPYALRAHSGARPVAGIRRELAYLRHLAAAGLPVPRPVGELRTVAGVHYDVTTWLAGTVRRRDLDGAAAYRLGVTLAAIHRAARTFDPGPDIRRQEPGDPVELLAAPALDPAPLAAHLSPADVAVLERVVATVPVRTVAGWETGMLHLDLILGNCVWSGDEPAVLDFADCRPGPFVYDLAPMLTNIGDRPELRAGLLAGYRTGMPLFAEQEALLPLLEAVRHVSFVVHNVDRHRRGLHAAPLDVHLPTRLAEIRALLDALR